MTFESAIQSCQPGVCCVGDTIKVGGSATFVFEEIAHPRPAGQHELSHILDNLGLLLGRESGEPLGQALRRNLLVGFKPGGRNGVGDEDAPLCPGGRAESNSWWGSVCLHLFREDTVSLT